MADPVHSRLNMIEIYTYMSDYRTAYHMAHTLFLDIKSPDSNCKQFMNPKDTMRTISLLIYLTEKLKMWVSVLDIYESFIVSKDIMTKCNPFSLWYIIEHSKEIP